MVSKQEHELAMWSMKQAVAYKKGKLTKEQIRKLKSLKFPFAYYLRMAKRYGLYKR
jgi:hypothetical protein